MDRLRDASEFRAWRSEVADLYPACLIGSRAVALMGIRTPVVSFSARLQLSQKGHQTCGRLLIRSMQSSHSRTHARISRLDGDLVCYRFIPASIVKNAPRNAREFVGECGGKLVFV